MHRCLPGADAEQCRIAAAPWSSREAHAIFGAMKYGQGSRGLVSKPCGGLTVVIITAHTFQYQNLFAVCSASSKLPSAVQNHVTDGDVHVPHILKHDRHRHMAPLWMPLGSGHVRTCVGRATSAGRATFKSCRKLTGECTRVPEGGCRSERRSSEDGEPSAPWPHLSRRDRQCGGFCCCSAVTTTRPALLVLGALDGNHPQRRRLWLA